MKLLVDVKTLSAANRILRLHWGGWAFAATNAFSAALVWFNVPGSLRYTGYEYLASGYFCAMAAAAAGLTWGLARRRKAWAGWVLLGLIGLAIIMGFASSVDGDGTPFGPFLFLRLWMGLSVVNAIRACQSIRQAEGAGALRAAAPVKFDLPRLQSSKPLSRWQRVWLFGAACWLVAVGFFLVVFDPSADIVEGVAWRVLALLVIPPSIAGAAFWGYRRFVSVADHPLQYPPVSPKEEPVDGHAGSSNMALNPVFIGVILVVVLILLASLFVLRSMMPGAEEVVFDEYASELHGDVERDNTAADSGAAHASDYQAGDGIRRALAEARRANPEGSDTYQSGDALRRALAEAGRTNPEIEAEARRRAQATGASLPGLRDTPREDWPADDFDVDEFLRNYGRTARSLTDPDNARIAGPNAPRQAERGE